MTCVAVSRGPAGTFAYDFAPIRDHAERVQQKEPRSTLRYFCPRNNISIAGSVPPAPDGTVIEFELGSSGFLTKPWCLS